MTLTSTATPVQHAAYGMPDIVDEALRRLGRRPRVVDVGAQMLSMQQHVYAGLLQRTPVDVIGFDPLQERMAERQQAESSLAGSLELLPYALGDGEEHTLYVVNDDACSSLFPLNTRFNSGFDHISGLRVVRTEKVSTHRMDDVVPPGPVDFLKLDVQGAELMVLQSGHQTLSRTAVVHCEVEFGPLYLGQPLYPEVALELAAAGFSLVDLVPCHYQCLNTLGAVSYDRLLWADAVFFRDTDDDELRAAEALVAAGVYGKVALALQLLGM